MAKESVFYIPDYVHPNHPLYNHVILLLEYNPSSLETGARKTQQTQADDQIQIFQ